MATPTLETILKVIDKAGSKFVSALKPFLPASITYEGKTYLKQKVTTARQLLWYFAAVARLSPNTAKASINAMKKAVGVPYDGKVGFYHEFDAKEAMGIDLLTIAAILTVINPLIGAIPLLLTILAKVGPPIAEQIANANPGGNAGGESFTIPDSLSDGSDASGMTPEMKTPNPNGQNNGNSGEEKKESSGIGLPLGLFALLALAKG